MSYDAAVAPEASLLIEDDAGRYQPKVSSAVQWLVAGAAAIAVALGAYLRFGVSMPLWLDETLTVNISRLPLDQIPGALKRDGAPPLFYVLLHFWMEVVGNSNVALRALPGIFGLLAIPAAYVVVRRIWGTTTAVLTTVLLASAPFAIYYSTEVRMYSLVMLESVLYIGALDAALRAATRWRLVALACAVAALLYTHYWTLYPLLAVGVWLLWRTVKAGAADRASWRKVVVAYGIGGLSFLPWLPIFLFQAAHTGTPWGEQPPTTIMVQLVGWFTWDQAAIYQVSSLHAQVLLFGYFALFLTGLVAVARTATTGTFSLSLHPRSRFIAVVVLGTLVVGCLAAFASHNVVTARYAAVAFVPLLVVLALGVEAMGATLLRCAVVVALATMGLWAAHDYRGTKRTEAPLAASVLVHHGAPGDVVAFCPDQLGPPTARLLPDGRYQMVTFPRFTGPTLIDWVDYEDAIKQASPTVFAARLVALAGPTHSVWLAWSPHAWGLHGKCGALAGALGALRPGGTKLWLPVLDHRFYQPFAFSQYAPPVKG